LLQPGRGEQWAHFTPGLWHVHPLTARPGVHGPGRRPQA
jgi:hypothetical protein